MNNNIKAVIISGLILVVGISILWAVSTNLSLYKNTVENQVAGFVTTSPTTTKVDDQPKTSTTPKHSLHNTLVKEYDGRRYEFSNNCANVVPNSFIIKEGTEFMMDNIDNKPHTFSFAGKKYMVKANGYVLIRATPSGNRPVFCDGIQRATINVEK